MLSWSLINEEVILPKTAFSACWKDTTMHRRRPSATQDWMEMIRIRMDQSIRSGVEDQIMGHLDQIQQSPDAPRVIVRRHLSVSNDLMIVLQWRVAPEAAGSSLAFSLCREFEAFGLVDHTVWSADCFTGTFRSRNRDHLSTPKSISKEYRP